MGTLPSCKLSQHPLLLFFVKNPARRPSPKQISSYSVASPHEQGTGSAGNYLLGVITSTSRGIFSLRTRSSAFLPSCLLGTWHWRVTVLLWVTPSTLPDSLKQLPNTTMIMAPETNEARHVHFQVSPRQSASVPAPSTQPTITASTTTLATVPTTGEPATLSANGLSWGPIANALQAILPGSVPSQQQQPIPPAVTGHYVVLPPQLPSQNTTATAAPIVAIASPTVNMYSHPDNRTGVPGYYPQVMNGPNGPQVHQYVPRQDPVYYYMPAQQAAMPVSVGKEVTLPVEISA